MVIEVAVVRKGRREKIEAMVDACCVCVLEGYM